MRAALFLLVLLLGACASEPAPYHSGNEIPRGPGLLTGPGGEFVLSADEWRRFQEWKAQQKQ